MLFIGMLLGVCLVIFIVFVCGVVLVFRYMFKGVKAICNRPQRHPKPEAFREYEKININEYVEAHKDQSKEPGRVEYLNAEELKEFEAFKKWREMNKEV